MIRKIYLKFIFSALMVFSISSLFAQQQGGSIVLTSFGDSTYVSGVAGEFNYTDYEQGQTVNVKGMYGQLGSAVELNVNYTVFALDWSVALYDTIQVFASTSMGNMDGLIDADFVIPMDADTFLQHDLLDPETDTLISQVPAIIQVRVWHDVLPAAGGPDVFWYEFVRVRPAGSLSTAVNDFERLEGVEIFPNPASNTITINTMEDVETIVMVYDMAGKRVINKTIRGNRLDVSNLHTGMHIIRVAQGSKMAIARVMIK